MESRSASRRDRVRARELTVDVRSSEGGNVGDQRRSDGELSVVLLRDGRDAVEGKGSKSSGDELVGDNLLDSTNSLGVSDELESPAKADRKSVQFGSSPPFQAAHLPEKISRSERVFLAS